MYQTIVENGTVIELFFPRSRKISLDTYIFKIIKQNNLSIRLKYISSSEKDVAFVVDGETEIKLSWFVTDATGKDRVEFVSSNRNDYTQNNLKRKISGQIIDVIKNENNDEILIINKSNNSFKILTSSLTISEVQILSSFIRNFLTNSYIPYIDKDTKRLSYSLDTDHTMLIETLNMNLNIKDTHTLFKILKSYNKNKLF